MQNFLGHSFSLFIRITIQVLGISVFEKRAVGFIFDNNHVFLDHVAPLCSLLKIPMLLTDNELVCTAKRYYPDLKVIKHSNYRTVNKFLGENFDIIFSCHLFESNVDGSLVASFYRNSTTIWMSHGLSEKGHGEGIFKNLVREKNLLVYGKKFLDMFKDLGIYDKIENKLIIGNYRLSYFKKQYKFYKETIQKYIKENLSCKKDTFLVAPTWDDMKNKKDILRLFKFLIKELPKHYNLIIKPHPNTYTLLRAQIERLIWETKARDNILFLKEITPIYPILDCCDGYIGDTSSIGYDFLYFNRPMFFIENNKKKVSPNIFQCGRKIERYEDIFSVIDRYFENDKKKFSKVRMAEYRYGFSSMPNIKEFIKTVEIIGKNQ